MDLRKEIESLLFSSGKVMTEKELAELTQNKEKDVAKAMEDLKKDYGERDTSLMIVKVGEGWKLNVKEQYVNLVTKIVADTELPFPVLETLAIIAYHSPAAMQAEVVKARGTNAYEHITELIEAGFIERRKEGRSFKIFLTTKFFEYFDVEGDKDIKEYLKDVQPSETNKRTQKGKLGKLDVVDVLPETEKPENEKKIKKELGDLEIVDELTPREEDSEDNESTSFSHASKEEKVTVDNNKPDENFLSKIESQIDEISKKNDDRDDDEDFKKRMNSEETEEELTEPKEDFEEENKDKADERKEGEKETEEERNEKRKSDELF